MAQSSAPLQNHRGSSNAAESGQAIVWVAVMLPLLLSVVGLAIDAGIVFSARRSLQNIADAAARAGAMQIDQDVYRRSSGTTLVLSQEEAQAAAAAYLEDLGTGLTASITTEPQRVVVDVSTEIPTSFLRIVGVSSVRISAASPADLRFGITGPGS